MKMLRRQEAASSLGFRQLDVIPLPGLTPYRPMWERQRSLAAAREQQQIGDLLMLLEHPHVCLWSPTGAHRHNE